MSTAARYEDGVFQPLEEVKGAAKGRVYRVFPEEELRGMKDEFMWLKAAENSFEFWDNAGDGVYDGI